MFKVIIIIIIIIIISREHTHTVLGTLFWFLVF